jgi:hypothetical protein
MGWDGLANTLQHSLTQGSGSGILRLSTLVDSACLLEREGRASLGAIFAAMSITVAKKAQQMNPQLGYFRRSAIDGGWPGPARPDGLDLAHRQEIC